MRVKTLGQIRNGREETMISEEQVRSAADRMGVNVDELGASMNELRRGVEVELEHTPVVDEALRIALEHLQEVPDYYQRLAVAVEGERMLPWHYTPTAPIDVNQAVKAQWVRLLDVVLVGPLMVAGGTALSARGSGGWGFLLKFLGVATVVYNGYNWWTIQKAIERARTTA